MRKGFKLLPMILVILMLTTTVFAEPIKVLVENKPLVLEVAPMVQDGRTLVPLRAIFEALGATVEWEPSTKTITGTQENKIIILQLDNKIASIDGVEVELDVPATAINGTTLVPVRFIAESLDAKVEWHNPTQTVLVNSTLEEVETYKVTRVVDGDTIIINFNGKEEKVRLIGMDTPESVHPDGTKNVAQGKIASEYTKTMLEDKEVSLEFDVQERDQYGRLLAYVYLDGVMVNRTLLKEGYAQIATFPPNVKYVAEFMELERVARENNMGLWNKNINTEIEEHKEEIKPEVKPEQPQKNINDSLVAYPGEDTRLTMIGTPGVQYNISVYYSSGASKAKGLEPKTADENGSVSWTWKVGSSTKLGQYKIVVSGDKTEEFILTVR